ncbi:MAG: hypothetical protein J1F61_04035 [Clostridiales bacterium]|nr:hypothetical protein [Clostridiales bacterium]
MRVVRLDTEKQLKKFVGMPDKLYGKDKFFVPYMRRDLLKTLKLLVLKEKSYTALAVEENGKFLARVLFTVGPSKQLKLECCGYFSHFECINDSLCAGMLFSEMCRILKEQGVTYVEGTYFPYDQDNRRGILVEGFEYEPMILTSYNPPYYKQLFEGFGFKKDFDTVALKIEYDRYDSKRVAPLVEKVLKRYDLYISPADFKNIERDIDDVHTIIEEATSDIIFQDAPTREDLVRIVGNWKSFLWADFIHICRRRSDGKPVGVMMSVPNFNTVFRKMNGRMNPVTLIKALYWKNKIKSIRAILQYVIPQYQNRGVNFALYHAFYLSCKKRGINYMEAGTILENNEISIRNVEKAGGKINKIFRIYGRQL